VRGVAPAGLGEPHTLAVTREQRDAQFGLERANLVADGAVGDEQFVGGARKAFVAGGGLECLDRVQWR
jgi:hypothetical protein